MTPGVSSNLGWQTVKVNIILAVELSPLLGVGVVLQLERVAATAHDLVVGLVEGGGVDCLPRRIGLGLGPGAIS